MLALLEAHACRRRHAAQAAAPAGNDVGATSSRGCPSWPPCPAEVAEQVEYDVKYAGYVARQEQEIERQRRLADKRIPDSFRLSPGSRSCASKPARSSAASGRISLAQASRISGITPADVALLMVHLGRSMSHRVARFNPCAVDRCLRSLGARRGHVANPCHSSCCRKKIIARLVGLCVNCSYWQWFAANRSILTQYSKVAYNRQDGKFGNLWRLPERAIRFA